MEQFKLVEFVELSGNSSDKILYSVIQFQNDPPTGISIKCPSCGKILSYTYLDLNNQVAKCFNNSCDLMLELSSITSKIVGKG